MALLTIPVAMWAGWSLVGPARGHLRRGAVRLQLLRDAVRPGDPPYSCWCCWRLPTLTAFLQAFVHRRRRYLWLFTIGLALMLYTQGAAGLFVFGAAGRVRRWSTGSPRTRAGCCATRRIGFGAAFVLFLPWLPATIYQIGHATAPWHYAPLLGADVPADLLGGERVDVTLLVAVLVGVVPLLTAARRRTPEAIAVWALIALPIAALALARIAVAGQRRRGCRATSRRSSVALLLLGAIGAARARLVGVVAIVLCVGFLANPGSFTPSTRATCVTWPASWRRCFTPGDLVVVGQPEQTPLAWYYLPGGLRVCQHPGPGRRPQLHELVRRAGAPAERRPGGDAGAAGC